MEWSDDKKNAYIRGYTEISDIDKEIASTKTHLDEGAKQWQADWEIENEKKLYSYEQDLIRYGTMYTNVDNDFRYSTDIEFFDDPTYLGYNIKIAVEDSPLWNYGKGVDDMQLGETGTALYFINRYGSNIGEIGQRKRMLIEFISKFESLFGKTLYNNLDKVKSYYIESIAGLDKLMAKIVKYPEDKLTITVSENVALLATYIAELYNNLIYSYNNQRYVIPENCLRFDLLIEMSDIRIFRVIETDENGNKIFRVNSNPPRIIFRLHDCNFDFSNSKSFGDSMSMAGFGGGASDKTARNLTFDIKYKSITREFTSPLIQNSLSIFNKSATIINNTMISNSQYFSNEIYSNEKIIDKKQREEFSNSNKFKVATGEIKDFAEKNIEAIKINDKRVSAMKEDIGKIPHVKTGIGYNLSVAKTTFGLVQQEENPYHALGTHDHSKVEINSTDKLRAGISKAIYGDKKPLTERLKDIAEDNVDKVKEALLSRFRQIRGSLIDEMLRHIREPFQMPRIYPDNVYSPDFRKLSIENFMKGLDSDTLNELEDEAGNQLNSLLGG